MVGIELLYCTAGVVLIVIVWVFLRQSGVSVPTEDSDAPTISEKFPQCAQDVLVGTLRNAEQLDLCLQYGFYHIPCSQVEDPENPIRYIAIYQSITLFGQQAGVRYYGRVCESMTMPRYQITQVYSESDEPYYFFKVQQWQELPVVIQPKETAFVSKRTNLFCLMNSIEVPQLWMESREEFALYEMLYRASSEKGSYLELDFHGFTVQVYKSKLSLIQNKKRIWSCTMDVFKETPYSLICHLRNQTRF